jgi:hypothetical protein
MGLMYELALVGVFAVFASSCTTENVRSVQLEYGILKTDVLTAILMECFIHAVRKQEWRNGSQSEGGKKSFPNALPKRGDRLISTILGFRETPGLILRSEAGYPLSLRNY